MLKYKLSTLMEERIGERICSENYPHITQFERN